jgi:hypothetical protein
MTDSSTDALFSLYHNNDIIPKEVEDVIVQPTVTIIEDHAFENCNLMKWIHIPNSVTKIGDGTFYRCTSLTAINIPNSITQIGHFTFRDCTSLTAINLPNSVTQIGDNTFRGCASLTSINIPNSVTQIGNGTFYNCPLLSLIAIPQTDNTLVADSAFDYCDSLEQRHLNGRNYHADINTWLQQRFDNLPLHQAIYNSTNTITTMLCSLPQTPCS